jgi:bacterioferritin-associated ferredoxin
MIVCHCHGVTDREIRSIVQDGAKTCADVADCCGASSGCGGCEALVAEIVQGERHRLTVLRSDVNASPLAALVALAEPALQSA